MSRHPRPPDWPDHQPDYLPPDVWELAKGLLGQDSPPLTTQSAVLVRLLGPGMKETWEGLVARGVSDRESWKNLLALFLAATPGAAFPSKPEQLRDAVKLGAELQAQIARQARDLAKILRQLQTLKADHCLMSHPAQSYLPFLVQMVTGRPPPIDLFLEPSRDQVEPDADIAEIQDAFDKHQREIEDLDDYFSFKNPAHSYLPYVVYPPATGRPSPIDLLNAMSCGGSGGTLGATTADVLDKLAEAAEQFPLTVQHAYQCHALGREKSLLAEWVRSIDNLFLFHFAHHIQPQGLRLTNADLVRLCYACLGDKGITNEEAVKQNRKRAKALPRDLQIRYGLIPPDECTGK